MRVLWVSNVLFPDVCELLGIPTPVVGGWMSAGAKGLLNEFSAIKLGVASLYSGEELKHEFINGIEYFLIPNSSGIKQLIFWQKINESFDPDITHIHGSEYKHSLEYCISSPKRKMVVSIQGLVSIYQRYYFGGIRLSTLKRNVTLRDILRRDTIFKAQKDMYNRGLNEIKLLSQVKHVIGRTDWDKAHAWAINPEVNYHFCNETLRGSFYNLEWNFQKCEKHSIFLSQAHYPIKGLHQLLKALPIVLKHFPNTKVYIAGSDFISDKFWKLNGYAKIIKNFIKRNNLSSKIHFTGMLNEKDMAFRYLKSHVFVCPSAIENSPNSVGEAQLIGVPCISSFVGGVANMIEDNVTGLLYRFDEYEMLSHKICTLFSNQELCDLLSENSRLVAAKRHNSSINSKQMISIYHNICNES